MPMCGASPRTPTLLGGCSGTAPFGGRKLSFPQLRSPPRSGYLEYSVLYYVCLLLTLYDFVVRAFGVRPRTTPILVFNIASVVSLPLREFSIAI